MIRLLLLEYVLGCLLVACFAIKFRIWQADEEAGIGATVFVVLLWPFLLASLLWKAL